MIIAAFDAGPTKCGYAVVEGLATGRVRFIAGGLVPSDRRDVAAILVPAGVVGVEAPAGFSFGQERTSALTETAYVAGGIAWLAASSGLRVERMTAAEARKAVTGKSRVGFKQAKGDMDRLVAAALPALVQDMPTRSNTHVRDALVVAVATWGRVRAGSKRRVA